jgi:hypothetical protein
MKYECTHERFLKDVSGHVMTIVRDDGVHRHLRFKKPDASEYYFDIITWPGNLIISGDMSTYSFARLPDMFEFFRHDNDRINPGYWAEKITACGREGYEEFDAERVREVVEEYYNEWLEFAGLTKEEDMEGNEIWGEIERQVLNHLDEGDQHRAMLGLYDFKYEDFEFTDIFEYNFKKYTFRYIWNCYAIAWAVQQYDKSKA